MITVIFLLISVALALALFLAGVGYRIGRAPGKAVFFVGVMSAVGLIALASTACSELGKPSTAAPRAKNVIELVEGCQERHEKIDQWERGQKRQAEDEWIDGQRGWLQSAVKYERIEREAIDMHGELGANCQEKHEDFPLDGPN